MKKKLLTLILFITAAVYLSAEVFVDFDSSVNQGDIVAVYLYSDNNIDNITLTLRRNNKNFGKFRGFQLESNGLNMPGDKSCYVVIVSVASDALPSEYDIDIRCQTEGYPVRKTGKITVEKKKFRREEIPLSRSMTTLRKDESERRKKETRDIIKLYRNFNKKDQFLETDFKYPLKGEYPVTSWFGDRRIFVYDDGDRSNSLHNGIDYAAVRGTPVYASGSGKVVFSGNRLITGNSIIIEHYPGFYSVYYHLDKAEAVQGSMVSGGDKIGEVGATGISTGNHLHWEVRNQGIAVDPEQFVGSPVIDKDRIISNINSSFSDIDRGR